MAVAAARLGQPAEMGDCVRLGAGHLDGLDRAEQLGQEAGHRVLGQPLLSAVAQHPAPDRASDAVGDNQRQEHEQRDAPVD